MATTLSLNESPVGGGLLIDGVTGARQVVRYGGGVLPALSLTLTDGALSNQATKWYAAQRTLAATTFDLLDLAGGLTGFNGETLTFTYIKRVLIAIVSPDGTKKVRVGPQNQSAPWQGPWGGTGATVYREVIWKDDMVNPYAGWAVTATTGDILPVYNPGATSVTYAIWIIGLV